MFSTARTQGGAVLVLDAGDSLYAHEGAAQPLDGLALDQARIKAKLMLGQWSTDHMDAAAVGLGDLALGQEWLGAQAAAVEVPLLASNLRCGGAAPWPEQRRLEAAGQRVLVFGLMPPGPAGEGCEATPPVAALRALLDAPNAMQDVDLVVVLSSAGPEVTAELAAAAPELDLVIDAAGAPPTPTPRALSGGAWSVAGGPKGRSVGLATIALTPGGRGLVAAGGASEAAVRLERVEARLAAAERQRDEAAEGPAKTRAEDRLRFLFQERDQARAAAADEAARAAAAPKAHPLEIALIGLDEAVASAPSADAAVQAAKVELEVRSKAAASERKRRDSSHFAGAAACASCHPAAQQQWAGTAHARAWASLQAVQRDQDLACWGCHSTGARQAGGPMAPSETEGLTDVQCEACHGPSAAHAASPATAPTPVRSPPVETCTQCHDGAQDGGRFDWARYRPQVVHPSGPAGG